MIAVIEFSFKERLVPWVLVGIDLSFYLAILRNMCVKILPKFNPNVHLNEMMQLFKCFPYVQLQYLDVLSGEIEKNLYKICILNI